MMMMMMVLARTVVRVGTPAADGSGGRISDILFLYEVYIVFFSFFLYFFPLDPLARVNTAERTG